MNIDALLKEYNDNVVMLSNAQAQYKSACNNSKYKTASIIQYKGNIDLVPEVKAIKKKMDELEIKVGSLLEQINAYYAQTNQAENMVNIDDELDYIKNSGDTGSGGSGGSGGGSDGGSSNNALIIGGFVLVGALLYISTRKKRG